MRHIIEETLSFVIFIVQQWEIKVLNVSRKEQYCGIKLKNHLLCLVFLSPL